MWYGVDPLIEDYPAWSPFNYVMGNPIRLIDPTGMSADDIIDIDKQTGSISITEAKGKDVVRLVNNGKVEDSYTYGDNGCFRDDNKLVSGKEGQALISTNSFNADKFFKFAAKSNVEFGIVDLKGGASIVATSNDKDRITTLPRIVKMLSRFGETGLRQAHSHPDGQSVPSGYYDNVEGNPLSLMPVPIGSKFDVGDAKNARQVKIVAWI